MFPRSQCWWLFILTLSVVATDISVCPGQGRRLRRKSTRCTMVAPCVIVACPPYCSARSTGRISLDPANPPATAATPSVAAVLPPQEPTTNSPQGPAAESPWHPLFDGKTMDGWEATNFGGEGDVEIEDQCLILAMGTSLTGVTRTGSVPTGDYEIELEAQRLDGRDFFCGLTFPAKGSHCSLIVGGWGGLVGISSIDGYDASENSTTSFHKFQSHRWYKIRVQVTTQTIAAWIDDEKLFDRNIEQNQLSVRGEVEASRPLGIATFETRAAFRHIRWRSL